MAVSPKMVPATVAAESVISTRPLPTRTPPPPKQYIDPMLTAILAALDRIQTSVDTLDKRVKAVEKPATHTKPTPATASAVSMPAKPAAPKVSNPVIDLKAKITTPRLPKPTTLYLPPLLPEWMIRTPSTTQGSSSHIAKATTLTSPRPPHNNLRLPRLHRLKQQEWVEVKTQPNHRRGIINLDYATVAKSEQVRGKAAQVTQAQNRTPQGSPLRRPTDRAAPDKTIITIVRSRGSEDAREEVAICALSLAFLILAAHTKIEQLTKHAIVLVGGWWVSKLDKKGNKKQNGNFNFTAAGNVTHEQVIQFQHVFLEHLKVGAIVTASNWVWAQLRHVCTTDH
jgi:hypothetical protein